MKGSRLSPLCNPSFKESPSVQPNFKAREIDDVTQDGIQRGEGNPQCQSGGQQQWGRRVYVTSTYVLSCEEVRWRSELGGHYIRGGGRSYWELGYLSHFTLTFHVPCTSIFQVILAVSCCALSLLYVAKKRFIVPSYLMLPARLTVWVVVWRRVLLLGTQPSFFFLNIHGPQLITYQIHKHASGPWNRRPADWRLSTKQFLWKPGDSEHTRETRPDLKDWTCTTIFISICKIME